MADGADNGVPVDAFDMDDTGSDSGSDVEQRALVDADSDHEDHRGVGREFRADRIAFHEFLALVAGNRFRHDRAPQSNESLVQHLRTSSSITSDLVYRAFLACPRGDFVPRRYADEAYVDAPIKVESLGFNISAPHMHATMLEALKIAPGDRVLDVGCGCGIVAACAAYLVGTTGEVVGLDVRQSAVDLCRGNLQRLRRNSSQYAERACEVRWEEGNVFLPVARHLGQYHKVHVGGNCPPSRLHRLHHLLRPEGGLLVAPSGNDLLLITKKGEHVEQRVISQVRFSELEVPTDAEIVVAAMQQEVAARAAVQVPAPTPLADLPDLAAALPGADSKRQKGCAAAPAGPDSDTDSEAAVTGATVGGQEGVEQGGVELGPTDCCLVGRGWRLPAHRAVLQARCDLFRAQGASGMRDAECAECGAPEGLSRRVAAALLAWAYSDALPPGLDASQVVELVRAATYYGAPRLQALCEHRLASDFLAPPPPSSSPPTASAASPRTPGATAAAAAVPLAGRHGLDDDEGEGEAEGDDDSSMVDAGDGASLSGDDGGDMEDGWHAVRARGAAAAGAAAGGGAAASASTDGSSASSSLGSEGAGALAARAPAAAAGGGKDGAAAGGAGAEGKAGVEGNAAGVEGGEVGGEQADVAMQLLALADECGLPQLRAAALAYAAAHYSEVAATAAYRALPRHLVDAVAGELHAHLTRFTDLLHHLSAHPVAKPAFSFW